jgi:hypothetical protein
MENRQYSLHVHDRILLWLTLCPITRMFLGKSWSILFNRAVTRKIILYYGGDSGHQTDLWKGSLGFGFIHYAFILNIKPKHILCIGSRKGFVPAICALACSENGYGHVDFVDAGYGPEDTNNWSGIGWWKRIDPIKHFSFLDVNKYLTPYIMTTGKFVKMYPTYKYDYIYIDGDHSFKGAQNDYRLFWPRLLDNGFMVFHDAYVRRTKELGAFGVWKLWEKIGNKNAIIFPFPKESGLGIVQKVTKKTYVSQKSNRQY